MTSNITFYSQSPYRARLEWGPLGAGRAAERGDIVVVVDVLSFSTAVAVAVSRGCMVYPCAHRDDASALARRVGAELAVRRSEVPTQGRFSLSPLTFEQATPGTKVMLASPNGAACCLAAEDAPFVFAGALVNRQATAVVINSLLCRTERAVTIVAGGEREKDSEGRDQLRVAIEDLMGAGALLSGLNCTKSPEAIVSESAFLQNRSNLRELLRECVSGRELKEMSFAPDVDYCSALDTVDVVPWLHDGHFEPFAMEKN